MVKGKTKSGFGFSVSENATDNMELLDALADLEGGNGLAFPAVCRLTLGDEQKKRLYDHVRTDDGRVPTAAVEREVMEIIDAMNSGKKSASSPT